MSEKMAVSGQSLFDPGNKVNRLTSVSAEHRIPMGGQRVDPNTHSRRSRRPHSLQFRSGLLAPLHPGIGAGSNWKKASARNLLRASAIVRVLIAHLICSVAGNPFWEVSSTNLAMFGPGTFSSVSGFFLSCTRDIVPLRSKILPFYRRRFERIYPLYWPALLAYLGFFRSLLRW